MVSASVHADTYQAWPSPSSCRVTAGPPAAGPPAYQTTGLAPVSLTASVQVCAHPPASASPSSQVSLTRSPARSGSHSSTVTPSKNVRGPAYGEAMSVTVAGQDLENDRRELTGYCYRMLGSAFEADDAVQETMLRAWRGSTPSRGGPALRSWLYRIATNVCLDMLRGEQRRALPMDLGPASPPVESLLRPRPAEDPWVTPIPRRRFCPSTATRLRSPPSATRSGSRSSPHCSTCPPGSGPR